MKAEIGTKVITDTGFGYLVLLVTGRTANTVATKHLNNSARDHRAKLEQFRAYDEPKCARIIQIQAHMKELREEQRTLFGSLERIE